MIYDRSLWYMAAALVVLVAAIAALTYWDESTCEAWGPERTEVTYYWDQNLEMMTPSYYVTRDCIRRKQTHD